MQGRVQTSRGADGVRLEVDTVTGTDRHMLHQKKRYLDAIDDLGALVDGREGGVDLIEVVRQPQRLRQHQP